MAGANGGAARAEIRGAEKVPDQNHDVERPALDILVGIRIVSRKETLMECIREAANARGIFSLVSLAAWLAP